MCGADATQDTPRYFSADLVDVALSRGHVSDPKGRRSLDGTPREKQIAKRRRRSNNAGGI